MQGFVPDRIDVIVVVVFLPDVFMEDVDLPQRSIRIADPELRLSCVAAFHTVLPLGRHAGRFEAMLDRDELFGIADAQASVVEIPAGAGGLPGISDNTSGGSARSNFA